jgi:hypothetical protein
MRGRPRKQIDPEVLGRLYKDERQSCLQIALALGCGDETIRRRLREAGFETRNGRPRGSKDKSPRRRPYQNRMQENIRQYYRW